jgi:ABC-2 type transport system ATP-binding protein
MAGIAAAGRAIEMEEPAGEADAVALQGITKRFNDIYALRNISITIQPGEVFGLLGPTGSGKTTLVRLLLGFLQPDEGNLSLFGTSDLQAVRSRIGYMPERPHYHPNFSGRDYLFFQARLSGLTRSGARKVVDRAIEITGLAPAAKQRIRYYERETVQRLALAVAMVSLTGDEPGLLLMDKPSEHLSRGAQMAVRDIILDFKKRGTTVLIFSHRITEIERTATSVGILRGGQLMAQTSVENNPRVIIVAAPRDEALESYPRLVAYLHNLHPFATLTGGGNGTSPLIVSLPTGPRIINASGIKASALRALMDGGWDVISVYVERKDLESIYARSAPPQPQVAQGTATGPLSNSTAQLVSITGAANTGRLSGLTQSLSGHNTRPLHASEVSHLTVGDPSPLLNGHQPIEGRALRREEA